MESRAGFWKNAFVKPQLFCLSAVLISLVSQTRGAIVEGDVVKLAGHSVKLTKIQALPVVESEYTKRFRFDSAENPKLKELREKYRLDDVVAAGKDEFDRQVLLLDWTHRQFKKFGKPTANPRGALEILKDVEEGNTFF